MSWLDRVVASLAAWAIVSIGTALAQPIAPEPTFDWPMGTDGAAVRQVSLQQAGPLGEAGDASPSDLAPPFDSPADCPDAAELEDQFVPISEIRVGMRSPKTEVPADCSQHVFQVARPATARLATLIDFHWQPTNFFHQPLYFDDTPLERYGQSICPPLQPIISGARFAITLPIVPYKMGVDRPYDCVTTLGKYRPGSCAPCQREVLPWLELDAGLLQAGTVVGLVFLLP